MKALKWVFGTIFVVVVIIAAALIILPMVIDPNDYKDQIVQTVKDKTGRDLSIDAPIDLSVFPWLGVKLADVSLSKAKGFGDEPFLQVGVLDVRVKLLPLLSKKVEVDRLVLTDLSAHLQKNKAGVTSWQDLQGAEQAPQEAKPETTDKGDGLKGVGIQVGGVTIKNAALVWDDATKDEHLEIDGINLEVGAISQGKPFDMSLALALVREIVNAQTGKKDNLKMNIELDSNVQIDEALQEFLLSDLRFNLTAQGDQVPGGKAVVALTADVKADMAKGTVNLDKLKVTGPEISLSGQLSGEGLNDKPAFFGKLSLAETNLRNLLAILGVALQTQDADALKKVSAELTVKATDNSAALNPLKLVLDDSTLEGFVNVNSFLGPVVKAELALDSIDIDRYLPPKADAGTSNKAETDAQAKTGKATAKEDPFAALKPLKLDARFSVGKLKVNNLRMTNMLLVAKANKGVLDLKPMTADLYQGKFDGHIALDVRKAKPVLRSKETLDGILIGPLLKDLTGEDTLTGKGNVHLDLKMQGLEEQDIRQTLSGKVDFDFKDGAYKGFNVADLIRKAQGQPAPDTVPQTDFAELSASANIKNGLIVNNDLLASSPLLRINGKGEVNLPKDTIDYLITTKIVGSLEGQGGAVGDKLKGVPIGIKLTGNLANPKPTVDLSGVLNAKAKEAVEKKKEKLLEKMGEKAGGKLDNVFKGLFNK